MTVYGQPVMSRETRRLLVTIVVSVAALWVLARIRFQERPATSTPVPTMLAQLRPASTYADLARVIADIRPSISAAIAMSDRGEAALRIREDAAITLAASDEDTVIAADRATGLAIVRRARDAVPGVLPWAPRVLDYPRYLVAADVAGPHVALHPVFVGALFPSHSPLWGGELWVLPSTASIAPGTFVFSTDGALAGLAVDHGGATGIVPAELLFNAAAKLEQRSGEPGDIGITVQPLSPSIAAASGAAFGVIVSAIDPAGPASGALVPTEVIEAVDGGEIRSVDHWQARVARATAGKILTLRIRNRDGVREVPVTAAPRRGLSAGPEQEPPRLGLRLRTVSNVGVEVMSVQPQSSAARAGIRTGDVITVAGGQPAPTSASMTRAFASLPPGGSLLIAVMREQKPLVMAIEK
jgi:hypothetical protein